MARKPQKRPSKGSPAGAKLSISSNVIIESVASVALLSLAVSVIEAELKPLFGSVPTHMFLKVILSTLITTCFMAPLPTWPRNPALASLVLSSIPTSVHWLGVFAANTHDPRFGPVLAYAPVLVPTVFVATNGMRKLLGGSSSTVKALSAIVFSLVTFRMQTYWSLLPYTRTLSQPLTLLISAWLINAPQLARFATLKKSRRNLVPLSLQVLVTLLAVFSDPIRFRTLPYTTPNGLLRILSSTPSTTGQIVVADDFEHNLRILRADSSLLGGVWIGERHLVRLNNDTNFARDIHGTPLGDTIYSTFVLEEATRLQVRDRPQEKALLIGLGIGIAAQGFMQHGLSTSIIEIDKAVYDAARDYFALDEPDEVYIEDARRWTQRQASLRNSTYDIIIHDCFSGGSVPSNLFTMEFWTALKQTLDPDGIVAVNFAGLIGSDSSKAVLLTLLASFGQCRVFHDYKTDIPVETLMTQFVNLVYFCSPSTNALEFREATEEDYLSSYMREFVLQGLPDREISQKMILGNMKEDEKASWILTDARNPLGAWQNAAALDHWKVMRTVLPGYVWATY